MEWEALEEAYGYRIRFQQRCSGLPASVFANLHRAKGTPALDPMDFWGGSKPPTKEIEQVQAWADRWERKRKEKGVGFGLQN